jgi:hypothetical protein
LKFHGIWKNQFRPVPSKIPLYVESGFLPVVTRTTMPPATNAITAVRIGVTMPPARCQSASRWATLGAPS